MEHEEEASNDLSVAERDVVRQSKVHYSKFSGQPRMDANARECGVNILIASDSRLFAFIRGFRFNNHGAYIRRTFM